MATMVIAPSLTASGIKNSVTSLVGSEAFLSAFVPVAVYNIIHNRVDYEPGYFNSYKLGSVEYKQISRRVPKTHPLFGLYHWLKCAVEDIKKKYLKELYIIVRDEDTKEIIEYYCFNINYIGVDNGPTIKMTTSDVMKSSTKLLQAINFLGEQEKLKADNISFALQVQLNDDAPNEYVTKSFKKTDTPFVNPKNNTVSFGSISTGFHKLRMHAMGSIFSIEDEKITECDIEEIATEEPAGGLFGVRIEKVEGKYGAENKKQKPDETKDLIEVEDLSMNVEELEKKTGEKESENFEEKSVEIIPAENMEGKATKRKKRGAEKKKEIDTAARKKKGKNDISQVSEDLDFEVKKPRFSKKNIATVKGKQDLKTGKHAKKGAENMEGNEESKKNNIEEKNKDTDCALASEVESLCSLDYFQSQLNAEKKFKKDDNIVCLCTLIYNISTIDTILCTICNKLQHAACCGYKMAQSVPEPHVCYNCYQETGAKINDVRMYNAKTEYVRWKISLLRLVCLYCSKNHMIDDFLELFPPEIRQKAVSEMIKYKLILKDGDNYIPNEAKITNLMNSVMFYVETDSMELGHVSVITID